MKKTLLACSLLSSLALAQETQPASQPATLPSHPIVVAPPPAGESSPKTTTPKPDEPGPVTGKWAPSLYGFVELDTIFDSTESFQDLAGNGLVARTGSYNNDHGRFTMGVRNSRLGFKLKAPEYAGIRTAAQLEMDFQGNQPSNPPATSESAFFGNPAMRIRHFNFTMSTSAVDLLFGQYWRLFGWQSYFHPNTVEIQGVPGQVYSRAPQVRLMKSFGSDKFSLDLALAAVRPVQRDSMVPDGELGLRFVDKAWQGWHTAGSTGSALDGLAIGVSGILRRFHVIDFTDQTKSDSATGWGVSIDALVPIIAATKKSHGNALTFTGSFVHGTGIADQYTGLSGGASFPTPAMGTYTADVDNGLVAFNAAGELKTIDWQSFILGLQYYLPMGNVWVSANFSQMDSSNMTDLFGTAAMPSTKVITQTRWADANLFWDVTPAVRLGVEYAWFWQHYADGNEPNNSRVQFSAFYLF